MCGIVCTNKRTPENRVADSIRHRGTYEPRFIHRDGFTFCHTLMPVQGSSPAFQPIDDGSCAMLFQGELWEHPGYKSDTQYLFNVLCNSTDVTKTRLNDIQRRFIENYDKMDLRILNKVYMSNAIEVRNPFLTKHLAEFCLGLDVKECLIGDKRIMKKALRDSYSDRIDSAKNTKLIARETMGIKGYYEGLYGKDNPRLYYPRFEHIFTDYDHLSELVGCAKEAKYRIVC